MVNKVKMAKKFQAFRDAWYDLADDFNDMKDANEIMSGNYPFDGCFQEMRGDVHEWVGNSIEELGIVTFHDMQESRSFLPVDIFEDLQKQDVGTSGKGYLVSYFESYYITIHGTSFNLHLMNNEYNSESLAELEKILWDDFLIDEMNTTH